MPCCWNPTASNKARDISTFDFTSLTGLDLILLAWPPSCARLLSVKAK
jgi:hypothetical protein